MYTPRQKVLWFAVTSRLTVIFLQFIFNIVCPDHEADAFRTPRDPLEPVSIFDKVVDVLFGGLTRWDAQYFIHIAKYGYTYENTLAFFPLYPMIVRIVARLLKFIFFLLNENSLITISIILVNFVCFVKSAVIFYDLSEQLFRGRRSFVAYKAAILYCMSPASIFFTAGYTEAMFAYLTFYSMLASLKNHRFVYLPIGLSTLVRSNGLINIGFPIFRIVQCVFGAISKFLDEWNGQSTEKLFRRIIINLFFESLKILNIIFLSLIPYFFLQVYNYLLFCTSYSSELSVPLHVKTYGIEKNFTMYGNLSVVPEWCHAYLPLAYATIQQKYWDVGFMNYYEFKQIPNFLLAFPILFIMLKCIYHYCWSRKEMLLFMMGERERLSPNILLPEGIFVFIVHGLFLTLFCIIFVHIQVSTRLLASASPLLYWYCANEMSDQRNVKEISSNDYEEVENRSSKWKVFFMTQKKYTSTDKYVLLYFCSYFVLGCFMFSNFLPWT